MSKKGKSKDEDVVEAKICMNCKHRQKPDGRHPIRGWCDNKASPFSDKYIYKGDTCSKFSVIGGKSKADKGKVKSND